MIIVVGGIACAIIYGIWMLIQWIWTIIQRAAREKKESLRREQVRTTADLYLAVFSKYLTECLIIDSNIWMNEEYEGLFHVLGLLCSRTKYKLVLFGPQFDEMTNIKKATAYGEKKNMRSRLAIKRIEHLQKVGLLNIRPVSVDSKPGAYADPLIVELLTSQARAGVKCTFISDDKELRIRVRQHLTDLAKADWQIVETVDIMADCDNVVEAANFSPPCDTDSETAVVL